MNEEMTDWFPSEITPTRVGEYNASASRDEGLLRWWDGALWSAFYEATYTEAEKKACRAAKSMRRYPWRGLANKPNYGGE